MTRSFLDELPRTTPERIDVYVDGCEMSVGKSNPHGAGGWGGVVVESINAQNTSSYRISGPIEADQTRNAERIAVLKGLQAAYERWSRADGRKPYVVVHTDQIDLPHQVRNLIEQDDNSPKAPIMHGIAALTREMDATIDYTRATKAYGLSKPPAECRLMDAAHDMASFEAYRERFRTQGFLGRPPATKLTPEESQSVLQEKYQLADRSWRRTMTTTDVMEELEGIYDLKPRAPAGKMDQSTDEEALDEIGSAARLWRRFDDPGFSR